MRRVILVVLCVFLGFIIGTSGDTDLAAGQGNQPVSRYETITKIGHGDAQSLAWHPTENILAVGTDEGVSLFTTAFSSLGHLTDVTTSISRGVEWSPNGNRLAAANEYTSERGSLLQIWDADTWTVVSTFPISGRGFSLQIPFAWSPDSTRIVAIESTGYERQLTIWDATSGEAVARLATFNAYSVDLLVWSPDGSMIAASYDRQVQVWEVSSGAVVASLENRVATGLAWSKGGQLAVATHDETVIWQPVNNRVLAALEAGGFVVWQDDTLIFLPDGRTIKVWPNWQSTDSVTISLDEGPILDLTLSPGGTSLAVIVASEEVRVYDLTIGTLKTTYRGYMGLVKALDWTDQGNIAAIDARRPQVLVWNLADQTLSHMIAASGDIRAMAWQPKNNSVLLATCDGALEYRNGTNGQLIRSYQGFDNDITHLEWNRLGTRFATVDAVGIKTWYANNHTPSLKIVVPHSRSIQSIDWKHDGTVLASSDTAGVINLWDTATGDLIQSIDGHDALGGAVAWRPDGSQLASGGVDGTVYVWNPDDGTLLYTLRGHTDIVTRLAWQSNDMLTSSGGDNTIRIWEVTREQTASLIEHDNTGALMADLAWNAEGTFLALGFADGTINLVADVKDSVSASVTGYQPIAEPTPLPEPIIRDYGRLSRFGMGVPTTVDWQPGEDVVAVGDAHGYVRLFDEAFTRELAVLPPPDDTPSEVEVVLWNPNGSLLAVLRIYPRGISLPSLLEVWDITTEQRVSSFEVVYTAANATIFDWNAAGTQIAVSNFAAQSLEIWDAVSGMRLATWSPDELRANGSISWSPDGARLASLHAASEDYKLRIWNTATTPPTQSTELSIGSATRLLAWGPDSQRIATADRTENIVIWDISTGQQLKTIPTGGIVVELIWEPGMLASTSIDSGTIIWDVDSEQPVMSIDGFPNLAQWKSDGTRLAVLDDGTVEIWDTVSETLLTQSEQAPISVRDFAWSPDGNHLATIQTAPAYANLVQVWGAQSHQLVMNLAGHPGPVTDVAWSPDGQYIASSQENQEIRLWDAQTGEHLQTFTGYGGTLAFNPASNLLASSWNDVTSVLAIPTGGESYQFAGEIFSNPWSPDGTRILGISDRPVGFFGGDIERRATIWDGNSGAVLFDIIDPILVPTQGVSWNADGSMILTGSSTEKGGLLYGWDGQTGDFLFEITGQPDGTHRIIPHPTRNIIAISYIADYGEKQSLLRIYDLESRQSIELVEFPIRYIDHFTWHPDGQSLAVEGSDGNIWLWDTSTFR